MRQDLIFRSTKLQAMDKIEDFCLHDLRHTKASWRRISGADIHTVAMVLDHKDLRMTAPYSQLSLGFMAEAMSKLDDAFGEIRHHSVTNKKALTGK
jgi:integrase